MASSMPLRHELKFFISEMQYIVLSGVLDQVLHRDPNGDELNEYHIRSLYFDTVFNDAYYDKLDGQKNRDKYRIRIYNLSDRLIKLECKTKVGNLISKRSPDHSPGPVRAAHGRGPHGAGNHPLRPAQRCVPGNDREPASPGGAGGLCAGSLPAPGGGGAHHL